MEEYHQLLDSKSFSEETTTDRSSSDQNDETGFVVAARSYECVFCKRGFTTAQALGGHMNIHRKDRANNKISISTTRYNNRNDPTLLVSPNTKKFGEDSTAYNYASTTFRSLLAIHQSCSSSSSTPPLQYFAKMPSEGIHVNYQTRNFPVVAATWGSGTARVPDDDDDEDEEEDEDEDDPHHEYLTLGIGIHTSSKEEIITQQRGHHHHHHHVIDKVEKIIEEDVEVDLELRLGYDKY